MTNEELLAKIKAEIERRHDYQSKMYHDYKPDGRPNDGWAESLAIMGELEELLSFLSTLESERPMNQDEVVINGHKVAYDKDKDAITMEEIPKDLEEAAKQYVSNIAYCDEDVELAKEQSKRDFIAGAKWQKQHDAELIEIAYNDGITIGMTKQKEQMMKGAVEGIAHPDDCEIWVNLVGYGYKFNDGDKVRIIIVKEDEK